MSSELVKYASDGGGLPGESAEVMGKASYADAVESEKDQRVSGNEDAMNGFTWKALTRLCSSYKHKRMGSNVQCLICMDIDMLSPGLHINDRLPTRAVLQQPIPSIADFISPLREYRRQIPDGSVAKCRRQRFALPNQMIIIPVTVRNS